jgi:hypothetical protein
LHVPNIPNKNGATIPKQELESVPSERLREDLVRQGQKRVEKGWKKIWKKDDLP